MAHTRCTNVGPSLTPLVGDAGQTPFSLGGGHRDTFFFFFFTLVTGPRRSLSLKLSDTRVYAPQIRARLGTTAHFFEVVVALNLSIWAHRFGETGLFSAPKLTDLHRKPSMSTWVDPSEAKLGSLAPHFIKRRVSSEAGYQPATPVTRIQRPTNP